MSAVVYVFTKIKTISKNPRHSPYVSYRGITTPDCSEKQKSPTKQGERLLTDHQVNHSCAIPPASAGKLFISLQMLRILTITPAMRGKTGCSTATDKVVAITPARAGQKMWYNQVGKLTH